MMQDMRFTKSERLVKAGEKTMEALTDVLVALRTHAEKLEPPELRAAWSRYDAAIGHEVEMETEEENAATQSRTNPAD